MADETYQVTLDDGREVRVTVPAGSSQDAIYAAAENKARSNAAPAAPAPERDRPPVSDAATSMAAGNVPPPKQRAPNWVVDEMPFWQQVMAGYGGKAHGLGKGVQQLFTFGPKLEALRAEAAERAKRDAPLYDTAGGALGGVLHDVAMAASPMRFMKAATFARPTTQAAIGGTLGGLQESTDLGGTLVNTGLGAGFGAGGQAVANRVARGLTPQATTQAQQLAAQLLKQYDIRVDPGAISNDMLTSVLRAFAGKELPGQIASTANEAAVTRAIADQLGLPLDASGRGIIPGAAEKARHAANTVYDDLRAAGPYNLTPWFSRDVLKLGAPRGTRPSPVGPARTEVIESLDRPQFSGADMVENLKTLRDDARAANLAANNPLVQNRNEQRQLANLYSDAEKLLEKLADQNLSVQGRGLLMQQYRDARKRIAQLHTVEDATNVGGVVSARNLAQQLAKDVPLEGAMRDVAEGATLFGRSMADNPGAISSTNSLLTQLGTMQGLAHAPQSGGTSLLAAGIPFLRAPVGRLMTSPAYLQYWANPATSIPGRLNRALTGGNTALLGEYLRRGAGPVSAGAGDDLYNIYTGR